jgi:hypothetical protein
MNAGIPMAVSMMMAISAWERASTEECVGADKEKAGGSVNLPLSRHFSLLKKMLPAVMSLRL